jgi:predicted XRE-type DNA-binding protein
MEEDENMIFVGSGNIYEDLGFENPIEAKAKADLALQIRDIIKSKNLKQQQAAELMGIDQPKVSDIVRGKLSNYTFERLLKYVRLLGNDIEIHLKPHLLSNTQPTILIKNFSKSPSHTRL